MQSMHDFMQSRRMLLQLGGALWAAGLAQAQAQGARQPPIRVAAASDLKFALAEIAASFERESPAPLAITYGSSGNLARQIEQGLPIDLFLSADEALVLRLHQAGWARDAGVVYAQGRLAWVVPSSSGTVLDTDLKGLQGLSGKLAIANPEHAPYGRAARSALQTAGLWAAIQAQLVLGDNVSQATQFVSGGAAQAGLVSLSLAAAPELAKALRHVAINPTLHPPIIQRMGLAKNAPPAAQQLYAHLQSPNVRAMFQRHGLG
jgi:molybdate transport system substrate-binding protein